MTDEQSANIQHVSLQTSDNVQLAGDFIAGTNNIAVVLLHMMPATKESYQDLSTHLTRLGFSVIAIDLRGHGVSGGGDYQSFTNEQHQKSIFDVMAAVDFLKKQIPNVEIGLVGASFGSSLALQYAAANQVKFLALLSPGLNYKGVETGRLVAALPEDLPVYFLAALDDPRVEGSVAQTETLFGACSSQRKIQKTIPEGGHGTDIINGDHQTMIELVEWVKESAQ